MSQKQRIEQFIRTQKLTNPLLKIVGLGTYFEVNHLAKVLNPDEDLLFLSPCKWNNNQKILAVVTSKRLIIINKGIIINQSVQSIYLDRITSVVSHRKLYFGDVLICSEGNEQEFTLNDFWWTDTERFVNALEEARYRFEAQRFVRPAGHYYEQPQNFGGQHQNRRW